MIVAVERSGGVARSVASGQFHPVRTDVKPGTGHVTASS
jgi:hypothetical protein